MLKALLNAIWPRPAVTFSQTHPDWVSRAAAAQIEKIQRDVADFLLRRASGMVIFVDVEHINKAAEPIMKAMAPKIISMPAPKGLIEAGERAAERQARNQGTTP